MDGTMSNPFALEVRMFTRLARMSQIDAAMTKWRKGEGPANRNILYFLFSRRCGRQETEDADERARV